MKEVVKLKSSKKEVINIAKIYEPIKGHMIIKNKVRSRTPAGIIIPEGQRTGDAFAEIMAVNSESIYKDKVGRRIMLRSRESEIVPKDRLVILKEYLGNEEMYYVQISEGTIMGVVTKEFERLTRIVHEREMELKAEESKLLKTQKPIIALPPKNIILP